jgi:hypothetical protein
MSSDVDVLILASGNLNEVENAAADAAFEAGMDFGESVEPIVYCLDEVRYPTVPVSCITFPERVRRFILTQDMIRILDKTLETDSDGL